MQVSVTFGHIDYNKYTNTQMHIYNLKNFWYAQAYLSIRQLIALKLSSIAQMQTAQPHMRSLQFAFVALITIQSSVQAIHALIRVNICAG